MRRLLAGMSDAAGTVVGLLDDPVQIDVVEAPSGPLPHRTVQSITAFPTTDGVERLANAVPRARLVAMAGPLGTRIGVGTL